MRSKMTASISLVLGGILWGLFWIPLRYLADIGLHGAWSGMMIYIGAALIMLAALATGRVGLPNFGRDLIVCGLLTGSAFSLYATALLLSDVVRVILLFYLAPVWGTLLGLAFLGERLTPSRIGALLAAGLGMMIVLGLGDAMPFPRNIGDWLALASGLLYAIGSMRIYQLGNLGVFETGASFVFGSLLFTGLSLIIAPGVFAGGVSVVQAAAFLPLGILMAAYILPMVLLTLWPSTVLTPAQVGLLLMSEVIVGTLSAALYSGEPFGWRKAVGSALIIASAFIEAMNDQTKKD